MADRGTEGPRPYRVLVVDDNRDAADSLALLIRFWGHDVRVAYDGVEGLRLASAYEPDCLLLDIGLPKLDGYRLAGQLRQLEALRDTKLIALTAYSDEEHRCRALEAGFDYQLVKPADPAAVERLLTMLQRVLKIAEQTESLAQQTKDLTKETKELMTEVKQEVKEVKEEIKEVKEEIKEVKNGLHELRGDGEDKS